MIFPQKIEEQKLFGELQPAFLKRINDIISNNPKKSGYAVGSKVVWFLIFTSTFIIVSNVEDNTDMYMCTVRKVTNILVKKNNKLIKVR